MKLGFQFVLLLVSITCFAIPRKDANTSLNSCLKQALNQKSPPERDMTRLDCLDKFLNADLSTCLREASKMEYLTYSEVALKNCYYSRPRKWTAHNCLDVAKKLHTLSERDSMRLDCFQQNETAGSNSRLDCARIAESFEQLHYRERFKQVCRND